MLFEMSQIGAFVFILALLGYLVREWYDIGHYGPAYRPFGRGRSFDRILKYSSQGFLLILITSYFFVRLIATKTINIPPVIGNMPVSQETLNNFLIFFFFYQNFVFFIAVLISLSLLFGTLTRFIIGYGLIIKTNDETDPMKVIKIYDESDDFFYYLDNDCNWGAIKKSLVNRVEFEFRPSILDNWRMKRNKKK